MQETENIVLTTVTTTENVNVSWFRDGVELKEGNKYEMKREGLSHVLIVKSSESKDTGTYMCQTAEDKMEFQVQIKGMNLWWGFTSMELKFLTLLSFFRISTEVCRWFRASFCCPGQHHDTVLPAKPSCRGCALETQQQRN